MKLIVLIKVFQINCNWIENHSPIKEINGNDGVKFQNEGK